MTDMRVRTREVNDATYAAWNSHDPDAVARVFAEDAVVREGGTAQELRGRAAIRERAATLFAAFPDFHLERVVLVVDGDQHADRWIMTGTHRGELFGLPATDKHVRLEGATFTRMGAHGLVVEDVQFSNTASLLAQLAAV